MTYINRAFAFGRSLFADDFGGSQTSGPSIFRRLFKDNQAATLIEYALIAGLVATATVSGMGAVGSGLRFVMGSAANAMN